MDELDALITTALGTADAAAAPAPDDAPAPAPLATEPAPDAPEATAQAAPEAAPEPTAADAPPVEATPSPDGTAQPAVVPATTPSPDLARVQADLERQRQLNAAWQQQFALQQQEQQIAQLRAQWEEMDPDEATNAKLEFFYRTAHAEVARRDQVIQQMQAAQAQAEFARQEAAAKPLVIDHLVKTFGLSDADRAYLDRFDTPQAMETYATAVKDQRRAQTEAARAARAGQVQAAAGAFAQTGGGTGAAIRPPKTYANEDELLADLFAS